jgi:hypothetical protein
MFEVLRYEYGENSFSTFHLESLKGIDHLENQGVCGDNIKIKVKDIGMGMDRIHLSQYENRVRLREHGIELPCFYKRQGIF